MNAEMPTGDDIRTALEGILPPGQPWVLVTDWTSLQEQVADQQEGSFADRTSTTTPTAQSYLVTRGLLEYGRDGHRVINAVPAVEED